jgi:hypothetical protein
MKYRLFLAFAIVFLAVSGLTGHVAAKHTTFKQLILPIDCQFQVVANGLGTVVYLTPEACGQVPPPNDGGSSDYGNTGGGKNHPTGSTGSSNGAIYNPGTSASSGSDNPVSAPPLTIGPTPHILKLNTKPSAYAKNGYRTQLSLGSTVSYLPQNQHSGSMHTLTVTNITATGVTVLMQPSGQFVEIPVGRTIYLDFDNNGNPSLEVHVLGATTGGQVKLDIRLVNTKDADETKNSGINPLLQVFVVILVAFTLISLSNYSWKWWLERK